jgi:hypothetical protein
MLDRRLQELESLEAINQDAEAREVVVRIGGLARGGRLGRFIHVVNADPELDEHTRAWVLGLANESFLLAADEYLSRCRTLH